MYPSSKLATELKETKASLSTSLSSIFSEDKYTLQVRKPKIEAPKNYLGPLVYPDNIVGKMVAWITPGADKADVDKLLFAAANYRNYQALTEQYKAAIQTSPFVQWALIPFLVGAGIGLQPIPTHIKNDVKSNKEFFQFLVQQGAKYKHYLAGAYGVPSLEEFKSLLEIYGVEASIPEKNTLNLMQLTLTSHYNRTAFDKVKALLLAGADMNTRIDEEYQNTILHYLIALEHNIPIVLKLIDFNETMPQCKIDYALQDKFGKTPLLLAIGLNETEVVEKLLKHVLEKNKKNIGLNIPDAQGRTPCMIAAALGHLEILKQLVHAGANCYLKDNQGRDLLWYANAPTDEVKSILQSFSIHPERIASVNHSYLYSSTTEAFPVVLLEKQTGNEHLVLLSREEPYFNLLKIALKAALNSNDPELNYNYLKEQAASFITKPEESILQVKLKNQHETRHYLKEVLFRFACAFGDLDTVEKLSAEKKFDLTNCDHLNRTAMHYVVMSKKLLVSLIKSTGYSRSAEDCIKDHPKVFDYLIHQNSELLDSKNVNGNTPRGLLERDSNSDEQDTREQAQIMSSLLQDHDLSTNMQNFSM